MKNMTVVIGTVGSGKSTKLINEIYELSKTHDYVFALNLEYYDKEILKVDKGKLMLFDTVEKAIQYMEENQIAAENVAIVIDNGSITINKENAAELSKLNFSRVVVSLQANRGILGTDLNLIDNEKVKDNMSQRWGIEIEGPINVITLVRK